MRAPRRLALIPALLCALFLALAGAAPAQTQYNIFPGWTTFNTPRFDGGPTYPGFVCNNIAACIAHANDRGGPALFIVFSSDFYSPYDEDFPPITVPIEIRLWAGSGTRIAVGGGMQVGVPGDSGSLVLPAGNVIWFKGSSADPWLLNVVNGSVTMPGGEMSGGQSGLWVGPSGTFNGSGLLVRNTLSSGIIGKGGAITLASSVIRNHIADGIRLDAAGGSLAMTGASEIRDNSGSGLRVMADTAINLSGVAFSANAQRAVAYTDGVQDTTPDVLAGCSFLHAGQWAIQLENGSFVEGLDLVDPVFPGQAGTQGAIFIGTGGTGSGAAGRGVRVRGTSTGAATVDLSAVVANGAARFARVLSGDLSFVQCTASGISATGVAFIDSLDSGPLGSDVTIRFDRCHWLNGAGSYACLNDGGGAFGANVDATNTIWAMDDSATRSIEALLSVRGDQTAASTITLRHCALKSGGGTGRVLTQLIEAGKRLNGTTFAGRGDSVRAAWSILDSSQVQFASSTTGSSLPLQLPAGLALAPSIAWRATGNAGFPSVPDGTLVAAPGIEPNGRISEFSVASARATNSTQPVDIDNVARPLPAATVRDIGANEIIGEVDTTPPTGTVVINGGDAFTNSTGVTLTLSADDGPTGSGVGTMRLAPGDGNFGPWIPFATSAPFTLTGGASGNRAVQAQFRDLFDNVSQTASDSIGFDGVVPTAGVVIAGGAVAVNSSSVQLTLSASDDFSGVDAVRLANEAEPFGLWQPLASPIAWSLSPGEGIRTVRVQSRDNAGNVSAEASDIVEVDLTSPGVILAADAVAATAEFPVVATFSEPVTGLGIGGFALTNATLQSIAGGPGEYTLTVLADAPGPVTIQALAAAAFDSAGNPSLPSAALEVLHDPNSPIPTITSILSSPTNQSPIPVTITFSEEVTGLDEADLVLGNATAQALAGAGDSYSVQLVPGADGEVTLALLAGAAQDLASNPSIAASFSITYDGTPPGVSVTSPITSPSNASTFTVTVQFTEPVLGLDDAAVVVGNGVATRVTADDGVAAYDFSIVPDSDGDVTISILAGAAADAADNESLPLAEPFSITHDTTSPVLELATPSSSPTADSPIPFTATFSEPVTGFDEFDLLVFNGVAGDFAGSGAEYAFTVTPVSSGAAQDLAGNDSTAASIEVIYNDAGPIPSITSTLASPTNQSPIPIEVDFGAPVFGFVAGDVQLSSGVLAGFTGADGDALYSFEVQLPAQGLLSVTLPDGAAQDSQGRPTVSSVFGIIHDTVSPTVALSTTAPNPTNELPIPIVATFSEPVAGLALGSISVTNGAVSGLATTDGRTWTFDLVPSGTEQATVLVPGAATTDLAGNANSASNSVIRRYDGTSPTVALSSTAPAVTNAATIPVTITFSEAVTGFAVDDLVLANATAEGFSGSLAAYSVTVRPQGDGAFSVTVPPGAAADVALNSNAVGATLARTSDRTAPASVVLPVADATRVGTTLVLGVDLADANPVSAELHVRRPGSPAFEATGIIALPGEDSVTFSAEAGANGLYGFAMRGTDAAGNQQALPAAADTTVLLNTVENGPFAQPATEGAPVLVYPMTDDLDVRITLSGALAGGTLTVSRTTPAGSPLPLGLLPERTLDEFLTITPDAVSFVSAEISWPYDVANAPELPIDTAYRVLDGTVEPRPVLASDGLLVIQGVTAFSDWYAGAGQSSVPGWEGLDY